LLHKYITLFDPLAIDNDEWLIKMLHDPWVDGYVSDARSNLSVSSETLQKAGWETANPTDSSDIQQIKDKITRALKLMLKKRTIGVTTVFATRILIDLHEIVGEEAAKLEEDLRRRDAVLFPVRLSLFKYLTS
jgi:hypothetical protein